MDRTKQRKMTGVMPEQGKILNFSRSPSSSVSDTTTNQLTDQEFSKAYSKGLIKLISLNSIKKSSS